MFLLLFLASAVEWAAWVPARERACQNERRDRQKSEKKEREKDVPAAFW